MPNEDKSNVSPLDTKQLRYVQMSGHFSSVGLHPQVLAYAGHYPISQWSFAPQGILYSPTHNSNYVAYDDFCYPSNNFPQLCPVREDMVLFTSEPAQCTSDQTPPPQANIPVDVYGMFEPYNALDNQLNTGPTQPCFSFESYEDVPRFETSPTMYDQYTSDSNTSDSSYYAYVQHLTRAAWAYVISVRSCPL